MMTCGAFFSTALRSSGFFQSPVLATKASWRPSGDQTGWEAPYGISVRAAASPPSSDARCS